MSDGIGTGIVLEVGQIGESLGALCLAFDDSNLDFGTKSEYVMRDICPLGHRTFNFEKILVE